MHGDLEGDLLELAKDLRLEAEVHLLAEQIAQQLNGAKVKINIQIQ